jgi:hypothetical protein
LITKKNKTKNKSLMNRATVFNHFESDDWKKNYELTISNKTEFKDCLIPGLTWKIVREGAKEGSDLYWAWILSTRFEQRNENWTRGVIKNMTITWGSPSSARVFRTYVVGSDIVMCPVIYAEDHEPPVYFNIAFEKIRFTADGGEVLIEKHIKEHNVTERAKYQTWATTERPTQHKNKMIL